MTQAMSKHHQLTYDAIFQHPIARNLHRGDVTALLGALAEVSQESNGNLKAVRNGQTLVLHASRDKNVAAMDELMLIRHFLERSNGPAAATPESTGHMLVVLDHREARIYKADLHASVPQRIEPYDPFGFGRTLHYNQNEGDGQRKPEMKSFYEAIAKTLHGATEILLFGSGTGESSAMEMLLADLRKNHRDLAGRVVGSLVLDAAHLTEDQLLAKAREFYGKRSLSPV
jgi:hypothetical protein